MDLKNQLLKSFKQDKIISKLGKNLEIEGKDIWDLTISINWNHIGSIKICNASLYDLGSIENWFLSLYPRSKYYFSIFPCDERIKGFIGQHLKSNKKHKCFILNVWHGDEMISHFYIADIESDKPVIGIGISDKFHGKKLGYFLINVLLKTANLIGLKRVYLSTMMDNKNAFRLYKQIGFKHINNIKVPVPGYDYKTDEYEMEYIF